MNEMDEGRGSPPLWDRGRQERGEICTHELIGLHLGVGKQAPNYSTDRKATTCYRDE